MRFLRSLLVLTAVLLLGVLLTPAQAWARRPARPLAQPQGTATAGGSVVQIGFDGNFQPTGWVPMKVRVNSPGGESGTYLIRVHQRDLDGDQVIYQRSVALTGGMANQEFWTYFKPQPVEALRLTSSGTNEPIRVVLADAGGRELDQLSLKLNLKPLYSASDFTIGGSGRGKRLILCISEAGGVFLGNDEYERERLVGVIEDLLPVGITPNELPDRLIGYDSVEAIVWQDADPALLAAGAGERMDALRQWVQRGGKLIVTARGEWQSLEPFFDLLPVTPTGAVEIGNLAPLQAIVSDNLGRGDRTQILRTWRKAPGPFRYILSTPKPDTIVESTFAYEVPSDLGGSIAGEAPFMARRTEGFGSVTFLALDFSNRNLAGLPNQRTTGWSTIWNEVLGLGDQPLLDLSNQDRAEFEAREHRDLGNALLPGSRLAGRSVALVTVALVFFIAYWLIAGPGLYFYLAAKRRTPMSWFFFGAAAVAATFVTLGVVKLILRGPPDLRHISIVRQGPGAPQVIHSEMGLYIPEDGSQRILIDHGAAGFLPALTGFAIDPEQQPGGGGRSNPIEYIVSLDAPDARAARDATGSAIIVDIPYRSTLKKLEADWIGAMARGIGGDPPRLLSGSVNNGLCEGRLVNLSGRDLVNVHIAFRRKYATVDDIHIIFIPTWLNGERLPEIKTLIKPEDANTRAIKIVSRSAPPSQNEAVRGEIDDWSTYWYSFLRSSLMAAGTNTNVDDWPERVRRTPAMLSFFSLLPPMRNEPALGAGEPTKLLRRGARELDVSAAVMAGSMVIVAEAEEVPLPIPMQVDGNEVKGAGRIIFQFIVPVDRSELIKAEEERRQADETARAATRPTTGPTTQPSSQPSDVPPDGLSPPEH